MTSPKWPRCPKTKELFGVVMQCTKRYIPMEGSHLGAHHYEVHCKDFKNEKPEEKEQVGMPWAR